jgi:N-acetylmuramoyl-L-alanine amidase
MPTTYKTQRGDCISSIAFEHGFFPETIWDDPANAALKAKRKNPNVLADGDEVVIPDKKVRVEKLATGKQHSFRVRGVPAKFKLRLQDDGKPLGNTHFTLTVDGVITSGNTDATGLLSVALPPNAKRGHLVVDSTPEPLEYELDLGGLPPVEEVVGMKARLANLGFPCDDESNEADDEFKASLAAFQAMNGLEPTGEPDATTRQRLLEEHDEK